MFQGLPVKDGVVFTTGQKDNQTSLLTQPEVDREPSPCLWWPCLIVDDPDNIQGSYKFVRSWTQNQRHSTPWLTLSFRCHEFEDDDNDAEDEWVVIDHANTMHIEELHTTATTVHIKELADDKA